MEEDTKGEKQVEFYCGRQHSYQSIPLFFDSSTTWAKSRLMPEKNMHFMDFLGIFSLGCTSCYTLQNPFNIIIHSLPSRDKRETWEQSKLPQSISCLEDPSRSTKRAMGRLKLPPGMTAMREVNVNHWFLLRAQVTFPLSLKLSTVCCLNFYLFFPLTHTQVPKILSCVSYLPIRNGRGRRVGERT